MAKELNVISVGYAFGDSRVRDIEFRSPATLLGADAVIFSPVGLQYEYQGDPFSSTYQGAFSLSESSSPRIEADVIRRRGELKNLLEGGGILVALLPAPDHWYIDTGERQHSGTGKNQKTTRMVARRDLYSVFPFAISGTAAQSRDLEVVGGEPFASFWRAINGAMEASAYINGDFGQAVLRIRGSSAVVGAVRRIGAGAVVILPQSPLYSDLEKREAAQEAAKVWREDAAFVGALLDLLREMRVGPGDFNLPEWAGEYSLAAEEEAAGKVSRAEQRSQVALRGLESARATLTKIQRRKLLFTGTGRAFEEVVAEAFRSLGLNVEEGEPGRTDRVADHKELGPAVVEAKGKAKSAGEEDSAQLEKWVSEYRLEHGVQPKPLLVVNAWRTKRLADRMEEAFPDQMLKYAVARGHCLLTGLQLLGAWIDVEAHPEKRDAVVKSLYDCAGRYPGYTDWGRFVNGTVSEASVEDPEAVQ